MQRTISFFCFLVVLLSPLRAHARVVVSELLWAGSDRSTADEWIELVYLREQGEPLERTMSGWTLSTLASDGEQVMVRFGSGFLLSDGDILLIANDHAETSRLSIEADVVTTAVSLPNTKLLIRLRDDAGTIVDVVDDGVGSPLAGANPSGEGKASMERINLLASGTGASNWRSAKESLNFDPGVAIFGTPGVVEILSAELPVTSSSPSSSVSSQQSSPPLDSPPSDSSTGTGSSSVTGSSVSSIHDIQEEPVIKPINPPKISITEILADPVGAETGEWIELWNAEAFAVPLAGLSIEKVGSSTSYQFPLNGSGILLPAGGYLSIHRDVSGITLDNEGADIVLRWNGEFLDALRYDKTAEGVSVGRPMDELLVRRPYCVPTEAEANTDLPLDPVIATQTLVVHDDGSVAANFEAQVRNASLETVTCEWDYGDGTHSSSCNPPSHTFQESGSYSVILSMKSYCGNTVVRTTTVDVHRQSSSASRRSEGAVSTQPDEESCRPSAQSGVVIDRLLPRPDTDDEERVILRNVTDASIDLCKWSVDDAEGGSRPHQLDGAILLPRGSLEVTGDESGIHWNDDGDHVRLFAPVADGQALVADVTYEDAQRGIWLVRKPDGSYAWESTDPSETTLARAIGSARIAAQNELVLVRAMPHPSEGEREWIEVRSLADGPRSLSGWLLDTGTQKLAPLTGTINAGASLHLSGTTIKLRDTDGLIRLLSPKHAVVGIAAWADAEQAVAVQPLVYPELRHAQSLSFSEDGTVVLDENGTTLQATLFGVYTALSIDWPLPWEEGKTQSLNLIRALTENKIIDFFIPHSDSLEARIFIDGREIEDVLLSEGLAAVAPIRDPSLAEVYGVFEALAKSDEKGMWGIPDQIAALAAVRKASVAYSSNSSSKRKTTTIAAVARRATTVVAPGLKLTAATLSPGGTAVDDSLASVDFSQISPFWLIALCGLAGGGGIGVWLYRWR